MCFALLGSSDMQHQHVTHRISPHTDATIYRRANLEMQTWFLSLWYGVVSTGSYGCSGVPIITITPNDFVYLDNTRQP
jgi:hypothetical protein